MYKFLVKNGQAIALGLGVLVIAIFLITVFVGFGNSPYDPGTDLMKLEAEDRQAIDFFNPGLALTLALAVLALVLAFIVFVIVDFIKFPKSAMKFILGFVVLLGIFFLIYALLGPDTSAKMADLKDEFNVSDSASKLISAGLWTTVGLAAFAVLAMVASEVRNAFK